MSTPARQYHYQGVHFLRKTLSYTTENTQVAVGVLPAGAQILKPMSGVSITTVFNDSGTDTIDIGTSGTADLYGAALAATSLDFVPIAAAVTGLMAADTTIYARYNGQNNNASAGVAEVIIAYIPDTDG